MNNSRDKNKKLKTNQNVMPKKSECLLQENSLMEGQKERTKPS